MWQDVVKIAKYLKILCAIAILKLKIAVFDNILRHKKVPWNSKITRVIQSRHETFIAFLFFDLIFERNLRGNVMNRHYFIVLY